ncbi:C-type mannose receptor 2 [Triplophysa tibetana]|uniref:C-type mannose receptor 2 n=1 Tax=Triplophysa tibetana TaxID=1572043 RepID=A0A5A9N960_9TELE|nr:C-type mannose receptor 2 [Triplophysa tibetana]
MPRKSKLLSGTRSHSDESNTFAFFHELEQGCLGVRDHVLYMSPSCTDDSQLWKWVTRGRLFNMGSSLCLGITVGNVSSLGSKSPLGVFRCDYEPPRVRWTWSCSRFLDTLEIYLPAPKFVLSGVKVAVIGTHQKSGWRVYGDNQDLCAKSYQEIYTIQGNSHGSPCYFPFLYDGQWFHSCTSVGREDGFHWCATTHDYGKDQRWGFCPVKSAGCETFWDINPLMDNCYQFNFQATLSWSEARTSCHQQGADLVSITKLEEQIYINGLLTGYSSTLWMGLNDLDLNGGWQWADSAPLKYLNWEADMPSYDEEENCGVVSTDAQGRWHNRDCSVALPYICKKRPNATLDPFTTDSWADDGRYQCDVGWQNFQAGCYRLNIDNLDWNSAHKTCQKMEANLVSIHTLPELEFITKHMKRDIEELWIGLHDTVMQMNFEWTDRTPVIFTFWHPFEPNNFRSVNEDCVTIWGPEGRWNDSPCNYSLPSICKRNAQKTDEHIEDHGCKRGWRWHSPSCFKVGEESLTFNDAKGMCNSNNATLVIINSRFEQAFVSSLVLGRSEDQFWLGLYNENRSSPFHWITGEELTYTNWNRDEPAQIKGGCGVMMAGQAMGLWEVKDCASIRSKYICEQNSNSSFIPSPPVPKPTPSLTGACPSGWKSTNALRHCFKAFHAGALEKRLTWIQAHRFCQKHGAQLASFSTPDEEAFVFQILHEAFGEAEDHEQHWLWIGISRRNSDSWTWSDGSAVTYQNFGRGNYGSAECGAANMADTNWLVSHCESELDWICEIPKGKVEEEPENNEDNGLEWVNFEEAQYKLSKHRSTWDQAQRICSWFDASLVSVHSPGENQFLVDTLRKMSRKEDDLWWMGLHTFKSGGRFRWSDHSVLNYVSWGLGQPRPISKEPKCIQVSASKGEWADQKCHVDLPFVCKRVNVTGTIPPTPSLPLKPAGCPPGWSPFQHKCYKTFGEELSSRSTWDSASKACLTQGAMIVTVPNHIVQAFLVTLLPNSSFHVWVGLTSESQAQFRWFEPGLLSYTNWAPGEPVDNKQNKSPGNCVLILNGSPHRMMGMWASRKCDAEKHGFICMKDKDPGFPSGKDPLPPALNGPLQFDGVQYRVLQKRLDWHAALQVCESVNGTLAAARDPRQHAYLTLLLNAVRKPAWIALYNDGGRSYTWLGEEEITFSDWRDGEPNNMYGCGHMTTEGQWNVAACNMKLNAAICEINTGGGLEWSDSAAVDYSNWEQQDANLSMLSANSCFWVQSNTGLWRPGSCKNRTHGVICKRPLAGPAADPVVQSGVNSLHVLIQVLVAALLLIALVVGGIYLYRRRSFGSAGSYEGARYSRTNSAPSEETEKNILVSDMELNEQGE